MRTHYVAFSSTLALVAVGCGDLPVEDEPMSPDTSVEQGVENDATAGMTGPQKNAVRTARNYLQMSGFSRQGLIDQLSSEFADSYEVADATAAVDSLDVDWNEQAARTAKNYLSMTGFSCKGLIEQLSSDYADKYTLSQAEYGAREAGAC